MVKQNALEKPTEIDVYWLSIKIVTYVTVLIVGQPVMKILYSKMFRNVIQINYKISTIKVINYHQYIASQMETAHPTIYDSKLH